MHRALPLSYDKSCIGLRLYHISKDAQGFDFIISQKVQRASTLSCDKRFVCVEVLRPSQPNGVMSSAVSLPNHTFTRQA